MPVVHGQALSPLPQKCVGASWRSHKASTLQGHTQAEVVQIVPKNARGVAHIVEFVSWPACTIDFGGGPESQLTRYRQKTLGQRQTVPRRVSDPQLSVRAGRRALQRDDRRRVGDTLVSVDAILYAVQPTRKMVLEPEAAARRSV